MPALPALSLDVHWTRVEEYPRSDRAHEVVFRPCWGSLLVLTLLVALDPVRLGATLLMISRPRPLQNMLVYWIGGMTVGVTYMLGPLTMLHVTPFFRFFCARLGQPGHVRERHRPAH